MKKTFKLLLALLTCLSLFSCLDRGERETAVQTFSAALQLHEVHCWFPTGCTDADTQCTGVTPSGGLIAFACMKECRLTGTSLVPTP